MSVKDVPWWGIASSAVPPVALAAGWTIAASMQGRPYDPVADTVSALAGTGATDRWVMTLALVLAGLCEVVTGLAPRQARAAGRVLLIAGGIAGILVALCPVHMGDGAPASHILWAVTGLSALAVWPLAASGRGPAVPWTLRPEVTVPVTVLLVALLALFGMELVTSAGSLPSPSTMVRPMASTSPRIAFAASRSSAAAACGDKGPEPWLRASVHSPGRQRDDAGQLRVGEHRLRRGRR